MCLATAYFQNQDKPILEEIAYAESGTGYVRLQTLLGKEKTVNGDIVAVDFSEARLVIAPGLASKDPA